jgi:hypothetical protein
MQCIIDVVLVVKSPEYTKRFARATVGISMSKVPVVKLGGSWNHFWYVGFTLS